jgi:Fe-S cluster assembly ATP-binding protein
VEVKTMLRLEVKNLNVEIDGKKILNGLDLTIEKGQVHAIRSLQHEG